MDAIGIFNNLADKLMSATYAANFGRVVIGLSGGVDSALSASIAAKALGTDNVYLFYLPFGSSDPHGFEDAKAVADHLGCSLTYTNITTMAESYLNSQINPTEKRVSNILARMRMSVLYDYSAAYQALVVGSSNKSEWLLGFTTLYGDTACAINPLGELYKTEVWEIARELKLPEKIFSKHQLCDLWDGAGAGKVLPSYEEVDKLLKVLEANGLNVEDAVKQGFGKDVVETTVERIKANEFKRKPLVVLKYSS